MPHCLAPGLALALTLSWTGSAPSPQASSPAPRPAPDPAGLSLGDSMPAFNLPKADGTRLDSNLIQGPVLVLFLGAQCPKVKALEVPISALCQAHGSSVVFLAINSVPGETFPMMKRQAQENFFGFPYLRDEDQQVARAYGARCTPDFFLFNRGRLVYHGGLAAGPSDPASAVQDLRAAIKAVEGGFPLSQGQTPSEGCPIPGKPHA